MSAQVVGVILASIGGWLLWSPWAFIIAGAVLVALPEIVDAVRR